MLSEDLEFLVAQRAEGTLDPTQGPAVDAALTSDVGARRVLSDYVKLDTALSHIVADQPVPEVRWDALHAGISRQIHQAAQLDTALDERAESQLARTAAGESAGSESDDVDRLLATDPHARLMLAEYATLDRGLAVLRAEQLPNVRWDALTRHISQMIDRSTAESAEPLRLVAQTSAATTTAASADVAGRIGFFTLPRKLAIAACLMLVAGVSLKVALRDGSRPEAVQKSTVAVAPPNSTPSSAAIATGVAVAPPVSALVEVDAGYRPDQELVVTSVEIGPPAGSDSDRAALRDALQRDALTRPSRSVVTREQADRGHGVETQPVFP